MGHDEGNSPTATVIPAPDSSPPKRRPRRGDRRSRNRGSGSSVGHIARVEPKDEPKVGGEQDRNRRRARGTRWWYRLTGACPISLEPLRTLPHEPFELRAAGPRPGSVAGGVQCTSGDYYDPVVLAAYFVSSGSFFHPTSRRPVERPECERLDEHLNRHARLRATESPTAGGGAGGGQLVLRVADAFDRRHEYAVAQVGGARLANDRREAEAVLLSLFGQGPQPGGGVARRALPAEAVAAVMGASWPTRAYAGAAGTSGAAASSATGEHRRPVVISAGGSGVCAVGALRCGTLHTGSVHAGDAATCPPPTDALLAGDAATGPAPTDALVTSASGAVHTGLFTVVDDDMWPSQQLFTGAPAAGAGVNEDFPALPPPRRPAVGRPRAPTDADPHTPPAGLLASGGTNDGSAPGHPGAAQEEPVDPASHRRNALAVAFHRDLGSASSFAGAAAARFTAETLALARADPPLVARLEAALDDFLNGQKPRVALWPMHARERALTQELARAYRLATGVYAPEVRVATGGAPGAQQLRSVHLFRTEVCGWPGVRLSDAAAAPPRSQHDSGSGVVCGGDAAGGAGGGLDDPADAAAAAAMPARLRTDAAAVAAVSELQVWHAAVRSREAARQARAAEMRRWIVERCVSRAVRAAAARAAVRPEEEGGWSPGGVNGGAQGAVNAGSAGVNAGTAGVNAGSTGAFAHAASCRDAPTCAAPVAAAWRGGQRLALRREAAARAANAGSVASTFGGREGGADTEGEAHTCRQGRAGSPAAAGANTPTPSSAAPLTVACRRDPLSWGAVRRLIWSAPDEAAAHETLRSAGLPTYARRRALDITGPADACTRLAAGAEWHLQLVELLSQSAEPDGAADCAGLGPLPASLKLDAANPYAASAAAEMARARKAEEDEEARAHRAGQLTGLLPRDFLARQPRRWRKAQRTRGVADLVQPEEQTAGAKYRPGLLLWGVHF